MSIALSIASDRMIGVIASQRDSEPLLLVAALRGSDRTGW
jgi:hypothetical protein